MIKPGSHLSQQKWALSHQTTLQCVSCVKTTGGAALYNTYNWFNTFLFLFLCARYIAKQQNDYRGPLLESCSPAVTNDTVLLYSTIWAPCWELLALPGSIQSALDTPSLLCCSHCSLWCNTVQWLWCPIALLKLYDTFKAWRRSCQSHSSTRTVREAWAGNTF